MTINYHGIDTTQNYVDAVIELISRVEGYENKARNTGDGRATIGYGYTFNRNNNLSLWTAAGITLSPADQAALQAIDNAPAAQRTQVALAYFSNRPITKDEARKLLRQTYPQYEGPAISLNMPLSLERVAFVDVAYNRGVSDLNNRMKDFYKAIQDGDRAEAWFQIRYNALGDQDPQFVNGIAKARYLQSQVFGLYDDDIDDLAGATSAFKMLQRHRKEIYDFEARFGVKFDGTNGTRNMINEGNNDPDYKHVINYFVLDKIDTVNQAFDAAKITLFEYLYGRTELPNLLISKLTDENIASTNIYLNPHKSTDTDQKSILDSLGYQTGTHEQNGANDLMIGMDQEDIMHGRKGNDILIGEDGIDSLFGEEGNDVLYGGDGDDFLFGGLDNDTMYGGEDNDAFWGGEGNDLMYGGVGNDTYIINAGDGEDTIEDKQGDNKIILCGIEISNFYFNGATYISFDGWQTALIYEGHFDVTDVESGTTVRLNENFEWGDFGTTLITVPKDILELPILEITNTIVGDLMSADFENLRRAA